MKPPRGSALVGLVLLALAAGFAVLVLTGVEGCGTGCIDVRVALVVVDARTGRPLPEAEVFVGWEGEVSEPNARAEVRREAEQPVPDIGEEWPRGFARTGPDGRATLLVRMTHCVAVRRWDRMFGMEPPFLATWDGVSIWVSAPGRAAFLRTRVSSPRTERVSPTSGGCVSVEMDLGRIALEPLGG